MAEENIPPPIISRPDDVQDFICTLCQEIPFLQEPVVTPCDHIFCKQCIETHLTTYGSTYCPNDRKPLQLCQLKPIRGVLKRLWEKVHVKCGVSNESDEDTLCCSWEGPLGAYKSHVKECSLRNVQGKKNRKTPLQNLLENVRDFSQEKEDLQDVKRELLITKRNMSNLRRLLNQSSDEKSRMERKLQEIPKLKEKLRDIYRAFTITNRKKSYLKELLDQSIIEKINIYRKLQESEQKVRKTREVAFDRSYKYDRFRVVELTQLMCKYVDCKPDEIDSGRIFNNVKEMHTDLRKNEDNPDHFSTNMLMLLATCYASNWFTARQKKHMEYWLIIISRIIAEG